MLAMVLDAPGKPLRAADVPVPAIITSYNFMSIK